MSQCPHCHSELVLGLISHQQQFRCAECGTISQPQRVPSGHPTNRAALWSFWLGISSIVLLWITGIPALILGIRALWQMRHQKRTKQEKRWAVTGTVLGTLFGLLLGGCLTGFVGIFIAAATTFSSDRSQEPAVLRQWLNEVVHLDIPKELKPRYGSKSMGNRSFFFDNYDDENPFIDGQNFSFTDLDIQIWSGTFSGQNAMRLRDWETDNRTREQAGPPIETGQLLWSLNGTPTEVRQETFSYSDVLYSVEATGSTFRKESSREDHYVAVIRHEDVVVGLDLSTQGPSRMTQDEVRQLFESLQIVQD